MPDDLKSGAYALHLTCEAGEDWLPLYVLPKRRGPFAPIVFLASTFTYQAYANHARAGIDDGYFERVAEWGAYPHNPVRYPLYGRSTYNRHHDGSGISFSSRHRPIMTMRPGFLTFNDARGSGMRHYPADLHLLAWLEAKGFDFDIVTDEDLDDEGVGSDRAVSHGADRIASGIPHAGHAGCAGGVYTSVADGCAISAAMGSIGAWRATRRGRI